MTTDIQYYVEDFFNNLNLYDDYVNGHSFKDILKAHIDIYLDYETSYNAFLVYEIFFTIYQIPLEYKLNRKNTDEDIINQSNVLLDFAKLVLKYENSMNNQNSIFIHSVDVFIFGLAIFSHNGNYREVFKRYVQNHYGSEKYFGIEDESCLYELFLYCWGISSLFMDIALPIENMSKPLKNLFNNELNSIFYRHGEAINIDFLNLNKLNSISKIDISFTDDYVDKYPNARFLDLFKPTDILVHKVSSVFFFDLMQSNLLRDMINNKYIIGDCPCRDNELADYGIVSSIIVLNLYGYLIQNYDYGSDSFFNFILDSATAIFLHNFYNDVLQEEPFDLDQLTAESHPIAFLLILCDEIQERNKQHFKIKDRLKSFIIPQFQAKIDENGLDILYYVGNSLDLGFRRDKREFINGVLDLSSIFPKGLLVLINRGNFKEESLLDMNLLGIQSQDISLGIIEMLAMRIYELEMEDYLQNEADRLPKFDELSHNSKLSYVRQAKSIPKKLNLIGCEITDLSDTRESIYEFNEYEIHVMAEFEHKERMEEKISQGWTYGEEKDEMLRKTPYLVSWYELPEDIMESNISSVLNIPPILNSMGLKVVNSKIRLLTFEIHERYSIRKEEETMGGSVYYRTSKDLFDVLHYHVKYSNYKQAMDMVKILKEKKYELVDETDKRKGIKIFNDGDLGYFAKREHEEWYKLKVNLGWTYGPEKDYSSKTNPNLVEWKYLDYEKKEDNKYTFKILPEMCKNVDLKIVKKY